MLIKDIQANQGNIDLVLTITNKDSVREFEKFGRSGQVCNLTGKDESGDVKITLWNDDVNKVSLGDKIHITNGWCSEFRGERQVSTGKFGQLEVLEANAPSESSTPETNEDILPEPPAEPELQPANELKEDEPISNEESVL
tara:strand:+ start:1825 stop:2247 length:423 start_codon:yes stop_codon:yes gene_type:complete